MLHNNKQDQRSTVIFSIYMLLSFYVFGGGMVDSLVVFRTWHLIGADEFPRFHQLDNALIIPTFVIFFFLSFIPQLLLIWFRPAVIPVWMIYLALAFNTTMLVSSITIQIPIQLELDKRFSLELIDELISTDLRYRVIPMVLLAITNFAMLYKVVKNGNHAIRQLAVNS